MRSMPPPAGLRTTKRVGYRPDVLERRDVRGSDTVLRSDEKIRGATRSITVSPTHCADLVRNPRSAPTRVVGAFTAPPSAFPTTSPKSSSTRAEPKDSPITSAIATHFAGSLRTFNPEPHARPRSNTKPPDAVGRRTRHGTRGTPRQASPGRSQRNRARYTLSAMPSRTRHDPPDSVSGGSRRRGTDSSTPMRRDAKRADIRIQRLDRQRSKHSPPRRRTRRSCATDTRSDANPATTTANSPT